MVAWLRRVAAKMAEPRVVTGRAIGMYAICFALSVALLVRAGLVGPGVADVLPPIFLGVGSLVASVCAWRGEEVARGVERIMILLVAGGLVSGVVVEAWDLAEVNDPVSYYALAFLLLVGALFALRFRHLVLAGRRWREVSGRVPFLV